MSISKSQFITWYKEPDDLIKQKIEQLKCKYVRYCKEKKYHLAVECINTLIAIGPYKKVEFNLKLDQKWIHCHAKIAVHEWINGNFEISVSHWKKILEKDLTFGVSYYYIGIYNWFNDNNLKAISLLEKAVLLKPTIENYKIQLNVIKEDYYKKKISKSETETAYI